MRDVYNEKAEGDFAKTYLKALQAIIRFDEQLAGDRLNKVRDMMNELNKFPIYALSGGNSTENAIFIELKNKSIMERGVLYGDLKSTSTSPWIRDPILLGMIKTHVELLGSPDDQNALAAFLDKTEAFFGRTAKPATAPQRALAIA